LSFLLMTIPPMRNPPPRLSGPTHNDASLGAPFYVKPVTFRIGAPHSRLPLSRRKVMFCSPLLIPPLPDNLSPVINFPPHHLMMPSPFLFPPHIPVELHYLPFTWLRLFLPIDLPASLTPFASLLTMDSSVPWIRPWHLALDEVILEKPGSLSLYRLIETPCPSFPYKWFEVIFLSPFSPPLRVFLPDRQWLPLWLSQPVS